MSIEEEHVVTVRAAPRGEYESFEERMRKRQLLENLTVEAEGGVEK